MTCREVENLLPLFFDGELEARQMRAVALHSTRCGTCEAELRELERIQELVSDAVHTRVEDVDLSNFWATIEPRLTPPRDGWWTRVQTWWAEHDHGWLIRVPAFGAALAVALLAAFLYLRNTQPTTAPAAPQLAAVDNAASIDSLDTDSESVAVLNDPETRTTVLWVSDDKIVGDAP